jgi:hypothetical protein
MTALKFIFKLMEYKVEQLYDDAFYVREKKYGLWYSTDREGNGLITSLTEQSCIQATRFYLKGRQEGFSESRSYEGEVGGKL